MKKLLLFVFITMGLGAFAQTYPLVSIDSINTPIDLAACNDTSVLYGDTVTVVGYVVTDGGLSEVASGSVQGGNRPFIFIVDTASGGTATPKMGIEVMGVYTDASGQLQPTPNFTSLIEGDMVRITGKIGMFNNGTQLETIGASGLTILAPPTPPTIAPYVTNNIGIFNDPNRVNNVQTGEQWEGSFVTLQNVTVSEVIIFSGTRISFNVIDGNGNKINVSDRFLAQKSPSHQVVNPNSPSTSGTGSFVAPVPGTFYNSISGMIRHDGNGCTSYGVGRGYEINPFLDSHYNIGFAPPYISDVVRDPQVPDDTEDAEITATITDNDGSVDSVSIAWTTDPNLAPSQFTHFSMPLAIGSSTDYEYEIPAQANGTLVRYYILAIDNEGNKSYYPSTPLSQAEPNFDFYTVRPDGLTIYDVQRSLSPSGNSSYEGQKVSVKGIVTSASQGCDLGYVYIQDPNDSVYAGISLVQNFDLNFVLRDEWIQVYGTVQEDFGNTRILVDSLVKLNQGGHIEPISVNPSDSAAYVNGEWEKYEGMLVKYENPAGGKLYISQPNLGFGDYGVATSSNAGPRNSGYVLAGRQSSSSYSSLYVQLVSDTTYATRDGIMNVTPIATSDTMTLDAVVGPMMYSFSNYRVLPRSNEDLIGLNVTLDSNCTRPVSPFSVEEVETRGNLSIYPNPANNYLTVNFGDKAYNDVTVEIFDLNGRRVMSSHEGNATEANMNVKELLKGLYIVRASSKGAVISTAKLIVNH